ncbi:MAG: Mini-ribonuclease 3 [Solobacterium sp.]|nr:Mini-ribonuclease 3 [Solobacterium sp.]
MNIAECSGRTLAFLGDAVWSLLVRSYLIDKGDGTGDVLQQHTIAFVSAKAQAEIYNALHEEGFFTEEEEGWFRRGRNSHAGAVPHNTPVGTYRLSTGFEALLGGLYMQKKQQRIEEIWAKAAALKGEEVWHNGSTGKTL